MLGTTSMIRFRTTCGRANFVATALLTIAGTAAAGATPARAAENSVSGTIWKVVDSDGDQYVYQFLTTGELHYLSPRGYYKNGTWKQDGDTIATETNKRFQERKATVDGTKMAGTGKNTQGASWTWSAEKIGTTTDQPSASIAGTIWIVTDSDDDHYSFEFLKSGVLNYMSPRGYYKNGTWTQNARSVYAETNKKFQERNATIDDDGTLSGSGKNTQGMSWTWTAVMIGKCL